MVLDPQDARLPLKQWLKRLFLPGGPAPRRVWFGPGRGLTILDDPATGTQLLLGLYEAEIARPFVRFARNSRTFCDVGAAEGWYGLLAHKQNPGIAVVALEPQAHLAARARENFERNGLQGGRWIEARCGTADRTLDEVLKDAATPILVKIDIEGAELDALESGRHVLAAKPCYVIVETHTASLERQCEQWLTERGYATRIVPQAWFRALIPEHRPLAHNRWLVAWRDDTGVQR